MLRPMLRMLAALLSGIGISSAAQPVESSGFWSMGTDRQWSADELDQAFAVFKKLKAHHGDRFNLVVQDLHREGTPKADGTATAQILIKIYVSPPSSTISNELKGVGMVFVKTP